MKQLLQNNCHIFCQLLVFVVRQVIKWAAYLHLVDAKDRKMRVPDGPLCFRCGTTCEVRPFFKFI